MPYVDHSQGTRGLFVRKFIEAQCKGRVLGGRCCSESSECKQGTCGFRGGLVCKAHKLLYHLTLESNKEEEVRGRETHVLFEGRDFGLERLVLLKFEGLGFRV